MGVYRILVLTWAVLFWTSFSWAEIPKNVVVAVIAADQEQTLALAQTVKQVRERYNISKEQLPIAYIASQKLTAKDYQRIGFTPQSLPVIALMKISSSQNLEGVLGNPPYIFRNVKQATLAAQVLLCRWSELVDRPIPADLRNVANIFQPYRVFVLNTAETQEQVQATALELQQVKAAAGITDKDLPVLSTTYHDGLLGEEEYTRLGFVSDAFPMVCLVQMSEAANPSKITGEGILRWSYNAAWSARQIVRLWARLVGRSFANLPDDGDKFSVLQSGWLGGQKLPGGKPALFRCEVTNYRYGVGGRIWLQIAGRLVNSQGVEVAPLAISDFKQEASGGPVPTTYTLTSEMVAPSQPGSYFLELEIRDKLGAQKIPLRLPFEV